MSPYSRGPTRPQQPHTYTTPNYSPTHLDRPRLKHPLHHVPVFTQHTSVVYAKPKIKEFFHLLVARLANVPPKVSKLRVVLTTEVLQNPVCLRGLFERLGSAHRLFPCVHEDHNLVALLHELGNLLESNPFEVAFRLWAVRLAFDTDEVLLQGDWAEGRIEVEETGLFGYAVVRLTYTV